MEGKIGIPTRTTGLLERDIGDAVVVMAETGTVFHTLQGTALFVWKLIDGSNTSEAMLKRLMEEYEVNRTQAAPDLDGYLRSLAEYKLISIE